MSPINHATTTAVIGATQWNEDHTAPDADEIAYDNGASGLTATDVQAAIDEVASGGAAPTLADVLAAGNDPGTNSSNAFEAASNGDNTGAYAVIGAGSSHGGNWTIESGDGAASAAGGNVTISGGYGNGAQSNPGQLTAHGGAANGKGGATEIGAGDAEVGTAKDGGDITLQAGFGDAPGRDGLIFLNLPTSDPGVAGALWCDAMDGNRVKVS